MIVDYKYILDKLVDRVPVSWDRLIEGLEEIQLRNVIRSVNEFLKTDRALTSGSDWRL